MKHTLLIICMLLVSFKSFGCDCKIKTVEEIRESSYSNADIVFLGEFVKFDKQHAYFNIIEIFKGKSNSKKIKITGNTSCSYQDFLKGIWLIYGKYEADSNLYVSTCGATRSFENPEIALPGNIALGFTKLDSLARELRILKNKSEGLAMLVSDIELYRSRKQKGVITRIKGRFLKYLTAISLILNIILVAFLCRKKNNVIQ